MAQFHTQIFIPQLANIEAAFQSYLRVLSEVKAAFEGEVKPEDVRPPSFESGRSKGGLPQPAHVP